MIKPLPADERVRDYFLRALVVFGAALLLITESLSVFHLIQRMPLIVCWILAVMAALPGVVRHRRPIRFKTISVDPVVLICLAGCAAIFIITGVTAAFSPPNSSDAMAYHMPRVVYWAEQSSVRFFPTQYLNQIMLQPFAEYVMLHTYVLTGGDHLINFVQWFASVASAIAVSKIAAMFGAPARGQAMAALFCATLPSGILASSGAKNDYFLAMWLITAVYFALRFTRMERVRDAVLLGIAIGLALLTKATAYLFAPWVIGALFLDSFTGRCRSISPARLGAGGLIAVFCALLVNTPQYVRNYELSGSVLGFDSADGNGFFRWRNERFGWRPAVSNLLRNTSEQLGARSERWNQGVYHAVLSAHQRLGIDVNDPATTWRWTTFSAPVNANHEASAPNRWHLAILVAASCIFIWRAISGRDRLPAIYALSLFCGFVTFCVYLKWQPFFSRMFLPLFVLGVPLTAVSRGGRGAVAVRIGLCVLLLDGARHPALDNWVRPLRGPKSVLHTPRADQYFADMKQWNNADAYRKSADLLAGANCNTIGIDITRLQLEYPLEALLRERKPGIRFVHTGVTNVTTRYRQPVDGPACAVVCLDCAGDAERMQVYSGFRTSFTAGQFLVFEEPSFTAQDQVK